MLSNPTRHFGAGTTDTVDFGAATILANLTGLAIRVVFYLDGVPGAFGEDENDRAWVSQWSATAGDCAVELGQGSGDALGTLRLNVSDGTNVATVLSSTFLLGNFAPYSSRQYHEIVAQWAAAGTMTIYLDGNVIGYVTNQTSVAAIVSTVKHLTIGGCSDATFLAPGISVREVGLWNAPLPSNLVQAMAAGNERSRMFSPSTFIGSCEMLAAGGGPEFMLSYGFGNTVPALSLSGTVTGTWVESHQQ